jgi:hypothetical protein
MVGMWEDDPLAKARDEKVVSSADEDGGDNCEVGGYCVWRLFMNSQSRFCFQRR